MRLRVGAQERRDMARLSAVLLQDRREAGCSRAELAAQLGVSVRTVGNWEQSPGRTVSFLVGWAAVLGRRVALVDGSGSPLAVVPEDRELPESLLEVATVLTRLRQERGLSQTSLGVLVGVGFSSVNGWENLAQPPRVLALVVWARALGCSVRLVPIEGVRRAADV